MPYGTISCMSYGTHVVWYIHMNVVGHAPWRVPYATTIIAGNCDNNESARNPTEVVDAPTVLTFLRIMAAGANIPRR